MAKLVYLKSPGHLALLADDGGVVVQGDIVEQRLQEYVGDADEVVILLRLVERV